VDEAGVKLQIGFNRRFDSEYRRIWEHLRAGTIGDPHLIHVISRDPAPPPIEYVKVSGGIFLDMMIHDFDMLRYLIGAEVEELFTLGEVRVDPKIGAAGDVDTALVSVKFTNGVIGSIDNSRRAVYGYDQRVEIFGSGGMLRSENEAPNSVEVSTAQEISFDLPLNFFMDRYVNSYIAEMEAFIEAVLEDRPTSVTGRDGKIPVIMGMAAGKSLREKRPVRLEEIALIPE
jgi:myo-inositol 2-dehydrogenase/D-chiro-inositol 1-dehydrogenase